MTNPFTLRSTFKAQLIDYMGDDQSICRAARVSVMGTASLDTTEASGLINYLMKHRHGSPFEHGAMTFLIEAPIFVWREFMRHRVGFSYNETSARYRELEPVFYVPGEQRGIVNTATSARPAMADGSEEQNEVMVSAHASAYRGAWVEYQRMLEAGIAKEVARSVLPVGIYSAAYVTCNPRSLMSFLSLRTHDGNAMFPSYPQAEIEEVARQMEAAFSTYWPLTFEAFNENGRVSP